MSRGILLLLFVLLFVLADFYIFSAIRQLIREYGHSTQRIISYLFWGISMAAVLAVLIAFFFFPDRFSMRTKVWAASFFLILNFSKILSVAVLFVGDIFAFVKHLVQKISSDGASPVDQQTDAGKISRSEFITKTALVLGASHIGAMSWGIISGAHDYRIRRIPLRLNNLPAAFHGLKLVQISDVHSGSFFNKRAVEGGVDMLLQEKPDMVFFTGDLVNDRAEEFRDYFDVFKRIQAPLGVYSTLGNHDYGDYAQWKSAEQKHENLKTLIEAHRLMGWNILMDEHRGIKIDGEEIGVVGIQNWGVGFSQHGDLQKAMRNAADFPVKLLLSHDPSHWRAQVLHKTNIDVAFAGHTHGMQYGVEIGNFKWSPVQWRYKEWAGLYTENGQQLYVNRGYGYLGYPGRLGILPEITVFELLKA